MTNNSAQLQREVDLERCLQSSDAEMGKSIWTKYDGYLETKPMWDVFPN